MMMRSLVLPAALAVISTLAGPAHAALVCDAHIASLDFGSISVRDGFSQQTSGPVTISCSGGVPGTTVQACVRIGSGSGGSAAGLVPRYLSGDGTASLEYQLTEQNTFSSGGTTWETVGHAIPLDATGAATIAPTLYAEVTSIGALATIGSYSSRFDAGSEVQLSYGEINCDQSGSTSMFMVDATVTASCTVSVSTVDFGPTGRRMANGGATLAYGLFHDPSRTSGWGLDPGTVATGAGTGANQSLTVFGRIFPNQRVPVGIYTDTVVVIVTY